MQVQPYLFFDGRCEEAIEFYKKTLGAEVDMLMRCKDSPGQIACARPATRTRCMHASLKIGETRVMASDGRNSGKPEFKGFALRSTPRTRPTPTACSTRSSDGGQVHDAAEQDLLLAALRHGRRQVRRGLDDHRRAASENQQRSGRTTMAGRLRHLARVRRAARSGVEVLHRSGAHEAMVGPEGLHRDRLQNGPARPAAPTTTA